MSHQWVITGSGLEKSACYSQVWTDKTSKSLWSLSWSINSTDNDFWLCKSKMNPDYNESYQYDESYNES